MSQSDDHDREAILARRRRFVARALDGWSGGPAATSRRTKAVVLTLSGLATACPCLKYAAPPPPPTEGEGENEGENKAENEGENEAESAKGETGGGDADAETGAETSQAPAAPE